MLENKPCLSFAGGCIIGCGDGMHREALLCLPAPPPPRAEEVCAPQFQWKGLNVERDVKLPGQLIPSRGAKTSVGGLLIRGCRWGRAVAVQQSVRLACSKAPGFSPQHFQPKVLSWKIESLKDLRLTT